MGKKVYDRLRRTESAQEKHQRFRIKRSEEFDYLEGVFDKPTLLAIYKLLNNGVLSSFRGVVSTGKESKVYYAQGEGGRELAVKIFATGNVEFRKAIPRYIIGDPRFQGVKGSSTAIILIWANKESVNLRTLFGIGLRVPEPIALRRNILVMTFIGRDGVRAPLLKETTLEDPEGTYISIVDFVKTAYLRGELVHGDLSEYNIMIHEGKAYVIDVSQAVSIKHPLAEELLNRDVSNINRYFSGLGVKVFSQEEILAALHSDG
jgi:RIO kinase 1